MGALYFECVYDLTNNSWLHLLQNISFILLNNTCSYTSINPKITVNTFLFQKLAIVQ